MRSIKRGRVTLHLNPTVAHLYLTFNQRRFITYTALWWAVRPIDWALFIGLTSDDDESHGFCVQVLFVKVYFEAWGTLRRSAGGGA